MTKLFKKGDWFTEILPWLIIILVFVALLLIAISLRGKGILKVI